MGTSTNDICSWQLRERHSADNAMCLRSYLPPFHKLIDKGPGQHEAACLFGKDEIFHIDIREMVGKIADDP